MLETLDGIIATAGVVLALSLVVQAIQQILKQLLAMKSSYMERDLVMMFLSEEALKTFNEKSKAMMEKVSPEWLILKNIRKEDRQIVDELKDKLRSIGYNDLAVLEKMGAGQLEKIIRELPMFAKQQLDGTNTLQHALDDIHVWFDLTKQSFQQHYERKMKMWSFFMGALVVMVLNADIVGIYKEFATSKVRRDAVMNEVPRLLAMSERASAQGVDTSATTDSARTVAIKHDLKVIDSLVTTFELVRWNTATGDSLRFSPLKGGGVITGLGDFFCAFGKNFLGWFGMTILLSLGAPFWYDLLKTLMGLKDKLKESNQKTA